MPQQPITRPSLTTNLEARYNKGPVNTGGGNAKKVGKPNLASTHFISEKDLDFQANLGNGGIANDGKSNALYHWNNDMGGSKALPTQKYTG